MSIVSVSNGAVDKTEGPKKIETANSRGRKKRPKKKKPSKKKGKKPGKNPGKRPGKKPGENPDRNVSERKGAGEPLDIYHV